MSRSPHPPCRTLGIYTGASRGSSHVPRPDCPNTSSLSLGCIGGAASGSREHIPQHRGGGRRLGRPRSSSQVNQGSHLLDDLPTQWRTEPGCLGRVVSQRCVTKFLAHICAQLGSRHMPGLCSADSSKDVHHQACPATCFEDDSETASSRVSLVLPELNSYL